MISANIHKIKSSFIKTDKRIPAAIGCLASVLSYFGHSSPIHELHKSIMDGKHKLSLHGIMEAARADGFEAEGYEGDINFMKEFYNPVILPAEKKTGYDYCFTLYGWSNKKFIIGDPHWGIVEYREDELNAVWVSMAFVLIRPIETIPYCCLLNNK